MYIERVATGYDRGCQQVARRGYFLLLVQNSDLDHPKAIVRKVALQQFGHFMMGRVRIYGESYTVSGAYGSDGLPLTVSDEVYNRAPVSLPKPLYDAWNTGGGWNSAGAEAQSMREWAQENLQELRK